MSESITFGHPTMRVEGAEVHLLENMTKTTDGHYINASKIPYEYELTNMVDLADTDVPEKFYITEKGCAGILRRKYEHKAGMNERLEVVLKYCSNFERAYQMII